MIAAAVAIAALAATPVANGASPGATPVANGASPGATPVANGGPPACLPAAPAPGLGTADPFAPPVPKATELNAAGGALYKQGKWEEARAQYRAALAADPAFLAPKLNIACSFVRQERFPEAAAEARGLVERGYVPWTREVLEAADLGALKVRPEMVGLRQAMAGAAAKWGEGLAESVVFVARQRAPLRIPEGPGVFILNPHQEVFAYAPATGLYRQLTADDGRVLAVARTPDGRRIVYVTAEKLVRGGAPGAPPALRGIAFGEITLATMTAAPLIRVDGDVRRIEIVSGPRGPAFRIDRGGTGAGFRGGGGTVLARGEVFARGEGGTLVPLGGFGVGRKPLAVLTADGALGAPPVAVRGACPVVAREAKGPDGTRRIELLAGRRPARRLGERFGAGLAGLPIP
jgi:hypothetical protein